MNFLDARFLFASLVWGAIGSGYMVYGRRNERLLPFLGGLAVVGASILIVSWFWMSLVCAALIIGIQLAHETRLTNLFRGGFGSTVGLHFLPFAFKL